LAKILKFFDADPGSNIQDGKNSDPGSGIQDGKNLEPESGIRDGKNSDLGSNIRDKHRGSAKMEILSPIIEPFVEKAFWNETKSFFFSLRSHQWR
jgi:hypothetical protein